MLTQRLQKPRRINLDKQVLPGLREEAGLGEAEQSRGQLALRLARRNACE